MITLKNGTFSIGAEGSYQNWLCRFRDAAKEKMTDFEIFMFMRKTFEAGVRAGLEREIIKDELNKFRISNDGSGIVTFSG